MLKIIKFPYQSVMASIFVLLFLLFEVLSVNAHETDWLGKQGDLEMREDCQCMGENAKNVLVTMAYPVLFAASVAQIYYALTSGDSDESAKISAIVNTGVMLSVPLGNHLLARHMEPFKRTNGCYQEAALILFPRFQRGWEVSISVLGVGACIAGWCAFLNEDANALLANQVLSSMMGVVSIIGMTAYYNYLFFDFIGRSAN